MGTAGVTSVSPVVGRHLRLVGHVPCVPTLRVLHVWCASWSVVHVLYISLWVCVDVQARVLIKRVAPSVFVCDVLRECRERDMRWVWVPLKTAKRKHPALT